MDRFRTIAIVVLWMGLVLAGLHTGRRDSGGGSGAEFNAASVPDWLDQIDPQVLDELARFVAERESSGDASGAAAAERLLALLTLYDT